MERLSFKGVSMRHLAFTLVSVLALTAPALAADTPAPAAATPPANQAAAPASTANAPVPANSALTAPAVNAMPKGTATETAPADQLAKPGSQVFGDVGKLIDPNTVPALRNVVNPGTQLRYLGDEYGLRSYFLTNMGQGQVVYISPDGQSVIIGAMFSGDGTPVTVMQLARMRQAGFDPVPYLNNNPDPAGAMANAALSTNQAQGAATGVASATAAPVLPSLSPGEQLLAETAKASWIGFGAPTGRAITVFMDPNCDHCHGLFKTLQPYVAQNKVYLRVIPVSMVLEQSRGDVLNIMSGSDPAASWTAKINGQPVPPPAQINPQAESALAANNTLFTRWQLGVTPYSVYRTTSGEIKVMSGQPTNVTAFLTELGVTP